LRKTGGAPRTGFSIGANLAQFSDNWYGEIYVTDTNYRALSGNDITDGNWHHLVFLRAGSDLSIYEDGSWQDTVSGVTTSIANGENLTLGVYSNLFPPSFVNGLIDEARISNVARSAAWITAEYNNQDSPSTFVIEGTPATP